MSGLCEPLFGRLEHVVLDAAHQHDVQHRVVGDQDIRWGVLHIPARPHLAAIKPREMVLYVWIKLRRGQLELWEKISTLLLCFAQQAGKPITTLWCLVP